MTEEAPSRVLLNHNAPRSLYPTMGKMPQIYPMHAQLGPYELICELGAGGMGTVYAAKRSADGDMARTVVVKTLRADLAHRRDLVDLFLNEARIISGLRHPFVCAVTDVGIADEVPYVAMEYLVGEPLSRIVPLMAHAPGETAVAAAVRTIADLCEGLHAAHELKDPNGAPLGLVHRDISPDNLFVLYDGTVRLVDFGIACTSALQKSGKVQALAGKCAYMSPQQLRAEHLDRRTDIWSLGVVLWEMLTGKRLFYRPTEVLSAGAVLTHAIPLPSTINQRVPPNLDAVVMHALERDVERRYANARELGNALHVVMATALSSMSTAKLGRFVDALFPGRQDFWRRIVPHSREIVQQSGPITVPPNFLGTADLEFDPFVDQTPALEFVPDPMPSAQAPAVVAQAPAEPPAALPSVSLGARSARRRARWTLATLLVVLLASIGFLVLRPRREEVVATAGSAADPALHNSTEELARNTVPPRPQAKPQAPAVAPVQASPEPAALPKLTKAPIEVTHDLSAHPVEPRRTSSARQGQVYLSSDKADIYVLVEGKPMLLPRLLTLPTGAQTLLLLDARGGLRKLRVLIEADQTLTRYIE